jgi:hypothetical protein
MCWELPLGGLPRSEAAHSAAELGFSFTAVLALVVMIVLREFVIASPATSLAMPARTARHPGGCKGPSCAAVSQLRAALFPGAWRRKVSVRTGACEHRAPMAGAGESMLDALRRSRAASLVMPSGAAGATPPETAAPRNARGRLSASMGNVVKDCHAANCFLASSTVLLLGRRRKRRILGTYCEAQA